MERFQLHVLSWADCSCAVSTWLNLWVFGARGSALLSPVCFNSFDITHQVLSKTDPKDLERQEHVLGQPIGKEHEPQKTGQAAVVQGRDGAASTATRCQWLPKPALLLYIALLDMSSKHTNDSKGNNLTCKSAIPTNIPATNIKLSWSHFSNCPTQPLV